MTEANTLERQFSTAANKQTNRKQWSDQETKTLGDSDLHDALQQRSISLPPGCNLSPWQQDISSWRVRCSGWLTSSVVLYRRKSGQCLVCCEWGSDVQPADALRTSLRAIRCWDVGEEREKKIISKKKTAFTKKFLIFYLYVHYSPFFLISKG